MSYAFATRLKDKNIGIKQLSFSGCMPTYGISIENFDYSKIPNFEHCHRWTKQAIDGITGDSRIETVIISYRIAKTLYGLPGEDFYKLVDDRGDTNRNKLWGALKDMINELDQAGKKTIFVIQSPELPRVIGYLIPKDSALKANGVNLDWWNRRIEYLYEHIDELETLTDVFDPAQIFCDNNICYAADTERAFYFDDHHLSVEGAEMIADRIIKQYLSNE